MANSRRRPRGTTPRQRRGQRRRQEHQKRSAHYDVVTLDPRHPARDIQELFTEADKRHFGLCIEAEARGDAAAALGHYLASPHVDGSPQLHDLEVLSGLGDDVPAWAFSRWVCGQAHRWLLFEVDPRIRDAVLHTLMTVYLSPDGLNLDDPDELFEIGTRLAVAHWVTAQLLLHDFGGLTDFIDCRATPELLAKAEPMAPWVASSIGGFQIVDVHHDVITLVDLADESLMEVLNIGAATGLVRYETVIGRVVPISTAPGLMFETRPLEVDEQTAHEVAGSAGLAWLTALYDAVVEGRLPEGYGITGVAPLMSDIVPDRPASLDDGEELPGRVIDLVQSGLSLDVAHALATCEVALIVAEVAPAGLGVCAPHAALGLVHDEVFEAALEHLTDPERELPWRRLARSMAEPVRSRCERLADACR